MSATDTPLFSWLRRWRGEPLRGKLEAIYIAPEAGRDMQALEAVSALPGQGLEGDRYAQGRGHWRLTDACQVTLVTAEDLARAERKGGIPFGNGEHRRNLVVSGIPLEAFRNRRVRIGEVWFQFHRPRPPCGYLERLYRPGAIKALGRGAGIGLRVVSGGTLRVGDPVEVLQDPGDGA